MRNNDWFKSRNKILKRTHSTVLAELSGETKWNRSNRLKFNKTSYINYKQRKYYKSIWAAVNSNNLIYILHNMVQANLRLVVRLCRLDASKSVAGYVGVDRAFQARRWLTFDQKLETIKLLTHRPRFESRDCYPRLRSFYVSDLFRRLTILTYPKFLSGR